ncbi:hypothetical protein GDO78_015545, partial [Eleutherodactylus coqui]
TPTIDVLNTTSGPTQQIPRVLPSTGGDANPPSTDTRLDSSNATTTAAVILAPTSNVTHNLPTVNPTSNSTDSSNHTAFENATVHATTVGPVSKTSTPAIPDIEEKTTAQDFLGQSPTWKISTDESITPTDETPIIAVMVALSSLLIIVFIIIVLYMLRFKKYKQAGSHSNSFRLSNGRADDMEPQSMPLLARSPSTNRKYPPLPVEKLEEEINRRMADDNKLFREEFNALPACPIQATCEAASKEENKEKNRYVNILPYDHSRLHLSPIEGVPDSDYINASFINFIAVFQGYQEKNKFIAAQGPKEETVNDFWRMIWEQNTATIVMVTNLKERKECKCAQYWPDQGCWTYGNIRVSVEDMTVLVDYTVRKFCIQQVLELDPANLAFLFYSAGVGRTGTFIVIDAMLDMMNAEKKVDVYGFVSRIRAQRCQMVQTDMQYVFIYQALLEHFLYGDTELEVTSLETHLQKLYNKIPGTNSNGLEEEFKVRTGRTFPKFSIPVVIIPVKRGEENTDYVNASFIDGYRQKDSYIASQGPLRHTIEDFWRMIWEWKSCSIVMLTELEERGQEKCAQYWPSEGIMSVGDITIELKKEEECESYTVRDLLVTNTRRFLQGLMPLSVLSAGAGRTGTFCALSTVLERVKAEGILDVFQTVKSLRLQRPHMVQTLEQYEFCYRVVQEYIDAFSDYANFK